MGSVLRWIRTSVVVVLVALLTSSVALAWLWQTRAEPGDIPLRIAEPAEKEIGQVSVTWLGISTLLFDDGETQIITDATFSRYSVAEIISLRPLASDIAQINLVLDEYHIDRLAAIVPLHSHFDHAIDAGHVANRTGAMILGSESTANIARGSNVPVDQYQTLNFGESRFFGDFTVTLLESRHVPLLRGDGYFFPGHINQTLTQPARVNAWQSGATYSVLIKHPAGTVLVKGSAGYIADELAGQSADVAMVSIAGLASQGRDYSQQYWQEIVRGTGVAKVFPIHFEDFTKPFGELALFPDLLDDVVTSSDWLDEFAADEEHPVEVLLPPLGKPIVLY